jgi:hypothetical protein
MKEMINAMHRSLAGLIHRLDSSFNSKNKDKQPPPMPLKNLKKPFIKQKEIIQI